MRIRQLLTIASLTFIAWGAFTYYLFLQRPLTWNKTYNIQYEIDQLESELERQYHSNQQLLDKIRQLRLSLVPKNGSQDAALEVPAKYGAATDLTVIAVLVFSCNRMTVDRTLNQLLQYRPSEKNFPIIVSQDCGHAETAQVIQGYGDRLTHIQHPDLSDISVPPKEKKLKGYYKIARHYGWALNQTFRHFNYDTVIIVEDDLDIAPDFFEYFMAAYPILRSDPTLWCVSAWNDNGKEGLVDESNPALLYRTDFFPGLGWMLTKDVWAELETKWPKSYWDDWMRDPSQRKDRSCIRPELSRTKTFGKIGVSNGLFYEKHLKFIKLNDKPVPFTAMDLSYLKKDNYDVQFVKQVYDSPSVTWSDLKADKVSVEGSVHISYQTKDAFKKITKVFGLMDDLKSGVPRTGYRGIVSFMYKGRRVYLAPPADWKGYDTTWS
ncbi:mannosyl (alpha-1,3-)-glycoprotein beta-1,2-N-acetylglucosaminyltransferase [Chamberlinius hualienensis]